MDFLFAPMKITMQYGSTDNFFGTISFFLAKKSHLCLVNLRERVLVQGSMWQDGGTEGGGEMASRRQVG